MSDSVQVSDWIAYEDAVNKTESVGGLGGCFKEENTWDEYLADWKPEVRPYLEAIKGDVLKTDRFLTGREHQDNDDGVPLFSDGTVGLFSFRAWGDLMAAIANAKDGTGHHYMEFYY